MLAEMIDKIVSLKETKIFEIDGQTYSDANLTRIPIPAEELSFRFSWKHVVRKGRKLIQRLDHSLRVRPKLRPQIRIKANRQPMFSCLFY